MSRTAGGEMLFGDVEKEAFCRITGVGSVLNGAALRRISLRVRDEKPAGVR